jgi:hypothetical protein
MHGTFSSSRCLHTRRRSLSRRGRQHTQGKLSPSAKCLEYMNLLIILHPQLWHSSSPSRTYSFCRHLLCLHKYLWCRTVGSRYRGQPQHRPGSQGAGRIGQEGRIGMATLLQGGIPGRLPFSLATFPHGVPGIRIIGRYPWSTRMGLAKYDQFTTTDCVL